jgi:hypothetical protein
VSDAVKSLLPALARLNDAERDELRDLLGPGEGPELTPDEWEAVWGPELERRQREAERTGYYGRPGDVVMRELKERFG